MPSIKTWLHLNGKQQQPKNKNYMIAKRNCWKEIDKGKSKKEEREMSRKDKKEQLRKKGREN